MHATEYGRNQGIHTDLQRYISSIEQQFTTEAWRVIVCSHYMKWELNHALGTPTDKTDVIPNGIRTEKFDFPFSEEEARQFRGQYAAPGEHLVVFSGRMVQEKGVHLLISAVRILRDTGLPVKLVIVGGGYRAHLEQLARDLGIYDSVYFTGFVPDDVLLRLYRVADAACFPSLYEPFGIVALEAMAAGTPVVVSDAGGLKEVVEHDRTGTVVWSGSVDSLVWGLRRVLTDRGHALAMADAAKAVVKERFNWNRVATETSDVYTRVWGEYVASLW
jgi:glycosyltransferase involved in cell wall biosynthesis